MSKKHKPAVPKAAPKTKTKLAAAIESATPVAVSATSAAPTTQAHCVRADLAALHARWEKKAAGKNKPDHAVADALARLDESWQALFRRREES